MLENIKPTNVMYYFEELTKIPHGSGNMEAISDYCVAFAKAHGLAVRQDELMNVVIVKEASKGYEDAPTVILQGHLDMVCEKDADVDFDFEKDALRLAVKDDYIYAKGTTLGGDDGIAIAMSLAILADDTLKHPRIEAVFTTEEETGMDGAAFLDTSDLKGRYMINLDSEDEGSILASCAGGMRTDLSFATAYEEVTGIPATLTVTGLLGGHSGTEIDKMHANANILLGRILYNLLTEVNFHVIDLNGGLKDNAIPREAKAGLCIPKEDLSFFKEKLQKIAADISAEYQTSDPHIQVNLEAAETQSLVQALSMGCFQRVLYVLFNAPNGVQTMSADLPGLVESSLNLGIMETTKDCVRLRYSIRSSVASIKTYISQKLCYMTEMMGGVYEEDGKYPGWAFKPESTLRTLAQDMYEQLYGKRPSVEAIHAGLECGLISEKIPGIDIISIGPDILDIHTPTERLSISSTERTYNFVVKMLEAFPKYCH